MLFCPWIAVFLVPTVSLLFLESKYGSPQSAAIRISRFQPLLYRLGICILIDFLHLLRTHLLHSGYIAVPAGL